MYLRRDFELSDELDLRPGPLAHDPGGDAVAQAVNAGRRVGRDERPLGVGLAAHDVQRQREGLERLMTVQVPSGNRRSSA